MADNTPHVQTLADLQRMADSTAQMQRRPESAPVQRLDKDEVQMMPVQPAGRPGQAVLQAKISSTVLNVAGERHDDYYPPNEARRDTERQMARQTAGGEYWTESEFTVTEDSWWNSKTKGESGDPVLGQFLQTIIALRELGGEHIAELSADDVDEAQLTRELAENMILVIAGGVSARYGALSKEVQNSYIELSSAQRRAAAEIAPKIDQLKAKAVGIFKGINADGSLTRPSGEITTLQSEAKDLNNDVLRLARVLNEDKEVTSAGVRRSRSEAMHFSAQASHETKGIWKIGTNHHDDIADFIKGAFVRAPKYNLISKADFNVDRDKFQPK